MFVDLPEERLLSLSLDSLINVSLLLLLRFRSTIRCDGASNSNGNIRRHCSSSSSAAVRSFVSFFFYIFDDDDEI